MFLRRILECETAERPVAGDPTTSIARVQLSPMSGHRLGCKGSAEAMAPIALPTRSREMFPSDRLDWVGLREPPRTIAPRRALFLLSQC